ncbi:MAG: LEA type 2 family protein [Ferruginibacter sp.]|nr:LEA type 2 family protein [Ferruginibacter sp.]
MKINNLKGLAFPYSIVFVFAVLFMTSCRTPKEFVYKDYTNFSLGSLGASTTKVNIDLIYYNPNNFGVQLKKTDLDVYVDGIFLGTTSQEYQINIKKRSDFTLPLSIDVDTKNVFKNLYSTLFNKEVTVKVTGKVKVGIANVFKSFPVNYEGKHQLSPLK